MTPMPIFDTWFESMLLNRIGRWGETWGCVVKPFERSEISKILGCQDNECPWLAIITKLMEYDLPVPCPYERWARAWLKNNQSCGNGRKLGKA